MLTFNQLRQRDVINTHNMLSKVICVIKGKKSMWETDSMVRNKLNQQELSKYSRKYWKNRFGNMYTKTGTMQRRPAWLLHKTTHKFTRWSLSFPEREKKHLSVMDWVMFPPDPCVEALTLYVTRLETEPFKKKGRSPKDGALVQEDWCSLGRGGDTRLLSHKGRPREESPLQARKRSLTRNAACWCFDLGLQPPELWEMNFYYLSCSTCGILLQQL